MQITHRRWLKLSEFELRQKIRKSKIHPSLHAVEEEKLIELMNEQRVAIQAERGRRYQLERMWSELMEPLKYELKTCRAMLRHDGKHAKASGYVTGDEHKTPLHHDDPRTLALLHYVHTLDMLLGKMTLQRRARDFTPYEIAKAAQRPNRGVHWADWVSPTTKVRIANLFRAVPKVKHVKRKTPFDRTVPRQLWTKLHKRLLERTLKELDYNKFKLNVATIACDDKKIERAKVRIERINQALVWIQEAEVGAALPVTWHGFFNFEHGE